MIEGNYANAVKRRTLNVNGRYIRGYGVPKYTANTTPAKAIISVEEAAKGVLAGKYGNGDARKQAITALGLDYNSVQARVNEIVKEKKTTSKKSNTQVAKEVLAGKWGNGQARKKALTAAGYNYLEVQSEVNRLLR